MRKIDIQSTGIEPESAVGSLASGPATPIDTYHRYYCGNMVYDGGERRLLTDEGYVTFAADGTPQYHFYLCDHLGNIRVVFDQTGAVEQVTHYYPFGGVMRESTNPGLQPYKYGGKELDRTSGLDAYDFGARMYFADRLQWGQMDPLCEKYYDVSPYGYCHASPMVFVDPNGTDDYFDDKGFFIKRTEVGSNVLLTLGDQYKNITEVDFTNSYDVIENIGRHYLSKSDKNDFKLTASTTGGDIPIDAAFSNDTGTDKYNVYLTNGHVNNALGNCYNFECITFHESTHRYDSSTHGGTIGEAYAIILTANNCPAWSKASEDYILSQASYAEKSVNMYAKSKIIPGSIVGNLNKAFMGYASFELNNNFLTKINQGCVIFGKKAQKK